MAVQTQILAVGYQHLAVGQQTLSVGQRWLAVPPVSQPVLLQLLARSMQIKLIQLQLLRLAINFYPGSLSFLICSFFLLHWNGCFVTRSLLRLEYCPSTLVTTTVTDEDWVVLDSPLAAGRGNTVGTASGFRLAFISIPNFSTRIGSTSKQSLVNVYCRQLRIPQVLYSSLYLSGPLQLQQWVIRKSKQAHTIPVSIRAIV